MNYTMGANHPK